MSVTVTTNRNSMAISDNNTIISAQIKIRRKCTLRGGHVRCGTCVHVPIVIRRSKAESMHGLLNISRSGLHVHCVCLWSGAQYSWLSRSSLLPRCGSGPSPRCSRVWARGKGPRVPPRRRPRLARSWRRTPLPRLLLLPSTPLTTAGKIPATPLTTAGGATDSFGAIVAIFVIFGSV